MERKEKRLRFFRLLSFLFPEHFLFGLFVVNFINFSLEIVLYRDIGLVGTQILVHQAEILKISQPVINKYIMVE